MSKRFRRGLVVGKFAPLHNGHVLVIETAREQCDHVVILSYSNPELAFSGPALRELWLSSLFPDTTRLVVTNDRLRDWFSKVTPEPELPANDADAHVHRDFVALLLEQVLDQRVDAVFTSEAYGPGFAEHLTKRFRQRDQAAPAVSHVPVDLARLHVPVSGSALRHDLWERWQYLPAPVARSLVQRVVFVGGESTGKSTLAVAMARELNTISVDEYGRELWTARGGLLRFEDLAAIACEQIRREQMAAASARRWLFCDTSPLTTLFYCLDQFGHAEPDLCEAAERRYDHIVLCSPDFPFVQDGTRQGPAFRDRQHSWYEHELAARGIRYHVAFGSLAQRVEILTAALKGAERRSC
jgi:NadR type nicotinamide-nucleotide adenylyltransferase